jgi:large subunit ribosomal protein L27
MSKTKQGGSSRLGRDSMAQRLGIKAYSGEKVKVGMVIVRQRGTKYLPGRNVKLGSDDTIYAMKDGVVKFVSKSKLLYNRTRRDVKVVSVIASK